MMKKKRKNILICKCHVTTTNQGVQEQKNWNLVEQKILQINSVSADTTFQKQRITQF